MIKTGSLGLTVLQPVYYNILGKGVFSGGVSRTKRKLSCLPFRLLMTHPHIEAEPVQCCDCFPQPYGRFVSLSVIPESGLSLAETLT